MTTWIKDDRGAHITLDYVIPAGGAGATNTIQLNPLYSAKCCEFIMQAGDVVYFINPSLENVYISKLDGFDLKLPYIGDIKATFDGGAIVHFFSPTAQAITFKIIFYTYDFFSTGAINWLRYNDDQYVADIYLSANTFTSGLTSFNLLLPDQYIDGSIVKAKTCHVMTPHASKKMSITTQSSADLFYFDQLNFIKDIETDQSINFNFLQFDIIDNYYLALREYLIPVVIRLYSFKIDDSDHVNVQGEMLVLTNQVKNVLLGNSFYVSAPPVYTGVSIRSNYDNITKLPKIVAIRKITVSASIDTGLQLFMKDLDTALSHTQILGLNKNDSVIGGGITFSDAIFAFDQGIYGHTLNTFTGSAQDFGAYQLIAGVVTVIELTAPILVMPQYLNNTLIELRIQATISTARISYLIEFDEILY